MEKLIESIHCQPFCCKLCKTPFNSERELEKHLNDHKLANEREEKTRSREDIHLTRNWFLSEEEWIAKSADLPYNYALGLHLFLLTLYCIVPNLNCNRLIIGCFNIAYSPVHFLVLIHF